MLDPAQRVAPDRDQPALDVVDPGEAGRELYGLVDRTAHGGDPACFVHGWTEHGEIEPLAATDIAVKDLADMQPKIHVGHRLAVHAAAHVQFGKPLARGE